MWSHQRPQHGRSKRRDQNAALRPKWAEARLHTAPCLRVFDRILSIAFDLAPAVLYFFERTFMFVLTGAVDEALWQAVHIITVIAWWFALSLYIYFGSVEDLTALVWIRRRAFPIRLFICVFLAPIVPLVVFFVSFFERTSFSCLDSAQSPSGLGTEASRDFAKNCDDRQAVDEVVAPSKQPLIGSTLAEDVGQGRINIEEMPPDLWLSLMYSFVSTRLNLQLAESTPGHRLFLFSVMTGSIPVVIWLLIMHAVTTAQPGALTAAYFTTAVTIWINSYRLCRSLSPGAFGFFMALVQIDVLTAGFTLEQLLGAIADNHYGFNQYMTIWAIKAVLLSAVGVILFLVDAGAQVRYGKKPKNGRAWFYTQHVITNFFRLLGLFVAVPALCLVSESMKLTTIVALNAIRRPAPEFTPSLAGLLSFVFRHTGKDGDTHDARTKHVMLAAARARKEQLIRMARDAPGGEVSPAAISMFKVCSCIEGVASDPTTTARDLITHDTTGDFGSGVAEMKEPGITQARCLRVFFFAYCIHAVAGTILPFIDVGLGSSAWSEGSQVVFLCDISVGILIAIVCTPAFVRYARFYLETARLTQFCPNAHELDTAWLQWVQSYHANRQSGSATTSGTASPNNRTSIVPPVAERAPPRTLDLNEPSTNQPANKMMIKATVLPRAVQLHLIKFMPSGRAPLHPLLSAPMSPSEVVPARRPGAS